MRKVILSMLVIGIMTALTNAESCTSVGATDKKYTSSGCSYKTEKRICCEDKTWSEWKEGKPDKKTDCKEPVKVCDEGKTEYAKSLINAHNGPVGVKFCQRICKNGQWKYADEKVECRSKNYTLISRNNSKSCVKYETETFVQNNTRITTMDPSNTVNGYYKPGLPSSYKTSDFGKGCKKSEEALYRYTNDDENVPDYCTTHFIYCYEGRIILTFDEPARYNSKTPDVCSEAYFYGACNAENANKCRIKHGVTPSTEWYNTQRVDKDGNIMCGSSTIWERCRVEEASTSSSLCAEWGGKEKWEVDPHIPFN